MADDGATRTRRWKLHKQGDHHMCGRACQEKRGPLRIIGVPAGSGENLDTAAALRELAAGLQAAYRADPGNALLARELRITLLSVPPAGDREAEAEWAGFLRDLSRPVPPGGWRDDTG